MKWNRCFCGLAALLIALIQAPAAPSPAAQSYVPGELVIWLTPDCRDKVPTGENGILPGFGIPELDQLNAVWQVNRIYRIVRHPHPHPALIKRGLDQLYLLSTDRNIDIAAMSNAYQQSSKVIFAGPNYLSPLFDVPNDPRYPSQWHLLKIQAAGAWDFSHGDTSVRIAVIDDAVDIVHPDIARNLWINAAEDLNGNGKFDTLWYPDGDLDGVDDDNNGYPDDVVGFDMISHDPNPKPPPGDDHGTHCWGISNAVTNNDTGVASIGWGCRGMAFRCGGGGFINSAAAMEALSYAINNGAWVSSHSYGRGVPYEPERALMEAAWDAGMMVCAAAGNSNTTAPHYPGAYERNIGVAASDANDRRSNWGGGYASNYGEWVDVASPGSGILSTVPGGGYQSWDGTSMATPLVAGLCALMKAANPGLDNETCRELLYNSCDTMPDPDYRAGLMGHGRINALKALAINRSCYLNVVSTHLKDPNGNGIAEPGELCGLSAVLENLPNWQTATNVIGTLSLDDPDIAIIKPNAGFPDIPAGGRGSCAADSFVFAVQPNAVPHMIRFRISKTANPPDVGPDGFVTIQLGQPRILLVNDFATDTVARWYRQACDTLLVLYDQYIVATSGPPSADTLRHYSVVIWFTGRDSTSSLSPACQTALAAYLDNGGRLFICGQNIGQQIGGTPFYANYLKAEFITPSTGKIFNLGIPGDPICQADTIVTGGAGGAANAVSVDGIRPRAGAFGSSIFKDYPDTTVYGSLRFSGNYKLVYFSMPFEAIDHSTLRYVQKWTILRRIMNFFGEPLPHAIGEEKTVAGSVSGDNILRAVPNPATRSVQIRYQLTRTAPVNLAVYDIQGRLIRTIAAGIQSAGGQSVVWDLRDANGNAVTSGIYFCTLTVGNSTYNTRLLVTP